VECIGPYLCLLLKICNAAYALRMLGEGGVPSGVAASGSRFQGVAK
jgi:hypothetical protein